MKILHVVHCIDTEGPLRETLSATFERVFQIFGIRIQPTVENLRKIQSCNLDLDLPPEVEKAMATCFSPTLLSYNSSWPDIDNMLDVALSENFRNRSVDDFGRGWVYSWHCMDHMLYRDNPRSKDVGYGNIFRFYRDRLASLSNCEDELNWHFHPLSINGQATSAGTSYVNSYPLLYEIIARRIIEDHWFPTVNRPGFHSERPDSHAFLEQWIPFDFANQRFDVQCDQPDLRDERYGDWRRAPVTWRGYRPCRMDYQSTGDCRRTIFRCMNVGTRLRPLTMEHVHEAFREASAEGAAILAFADHDYRDIRPDVDQVLKMINSTRANYADVKVRFSGAESAARAVLGFDGASEYPNVALRLEWESDRLIITLEQGEIFGPQPFLALETIDGRFMHDNLDVLTPHKVWSYTFDAQTIGRKGIRRVGVGTAGRWGGRCVKVLTEIP